MAGHNYMFFLHLYRYRVHSRFVGMAKVVYLGETGMGVNWRKQSKLSAKLKDGQYLGRFYKLVSMEGRFSI